METTVKTRPSMYGPLATGRVCPGCAGALVGIDREGDRYLFGCLDCGEQWSAPLDRPFAIERRWKMQLRPYGRPSR